MKSLKSQINIPSLLYNLNSRERYENEKKGKFGTYAKKRVAAGAHLTSPWLFQPAKCLEPTTVWAAVPSLVQEPGIGFYS